MDASCACEPFQLMLTNLQDTGGLSCRDQFDLAPAGRAEGTGILAAGSEDLATRSGDLQSDFALYHLFNRNAHVYNLTVTSAQLPTRIPIRHSSNDPFFHE